MIIPQHLGRMPVKSTLKALHMADFAKVGAPDPPTSMTFWKRRKPFENRTFGNTKMGSCTRSKQAIAAMRLERLECRRSAQITDEEVIRVYRSMSDRLYGGGDNGAYEVDALNEWRNPELTFRDMKGRPLTIDAYIRLNPFDHKELKTALAMSAAHGIAFCVNLPAAFQRMAPPQTWDVPEGTPMVGEWRPGSWGGHSMWAIGDYDEEGFWAPHTWNMADQKITWRAAAAYLDEAHVIIDSLNAWRKNKVANKFIKLGDVRDAVNAVSAIQVVR